MATEHVTTLDVLQYKVFQYMTINITTMAETEYIPYACTKIKNNATTEIIVMNSEGNPTGIVTDEDILKSVGEEFANSSRTRLEDVMTFPIVSISHNSTLKDALKKMKQNHIRKLVVLSNTNRVIGIIFQHTIVELIRGSLLRNKHPASMAKTILWNLGSVLQFAGILILIPALVSTALNELHVVTGIFLMATILLILGFGLNSYGVETPFIA